MFNYTDHLGNIRLSYTRGLNNTIQIKDQNHYYPFGLKHKKYNSYQYVFVPLNEIDGYDLGIDPLLESERDEYQYKYNGKGFQDELGLNFYDYGARNYDAALGRWMNMDPLAENSRRWTSYNYAYNNPMFFVDPDGMQAVPTDGYGRDLNRAGAAYDFYNYEDKEEDHIIIRGKNAGTGEMQPAIIIETSLVSTMIDIEDLPVFPTHDPIANKDTTKPIEIKGMDEFIKKQVGKFSSDNPDAIFVSLNAGLFAISGSVQVAAILTGNDAGGVFLYTPENPAPVLGAEVGGSIEFGATYAAKSTKKSFGRNTLEGLSLNLSGGYSGASGTLSMGVTSKYNLTPTSYSVSTSVLSKSALKVRGSISMSNMKLQKTLVNPKK